MAVFQDITVLVAQVLIFIVVAGTGSIVKKTMLELIQSSALGLVVDGVFLVTQMGVQAISLPVFNHIQIHLVIVVIHVQPVLQLAVMLPVRQAVVMVEEQSVVRIIVVILARFLVERLDRVAVRVGREHRL